MLTKETSEEPLPAAARARPDGLVIRAREPSDFAEITALMALPRVRWGTLRLPFTSADATRKWLEKAPEGHIAIVAILDGRLVGLAGLHPDKGRRSHVASIGLSVHDDFHARGIGSALVAALVDTADNWLNLRRLDLVVYVDNAPAIGLYEKFGFVIEGRRRGDVFRDGAFVDSFIMARLRGFEPQPGPAA